LAYNSGHRNSGEVVMRIRKFVITGLLFTLSTLVVAQTGKKIYLDPNDSFSAYFSAAMQKKKVPVTVTVDPQQADYTAQFQAKDRNGSVLQSVLSSLGQGNYDNRSTNEVSMSIIDNKSKDVVFSYTCSKISQYSNASSALASSVAECLAKHWKDSIH
jgi:GH15 family glucan-1,4-alpha-glucosidase